MYHLKAILNKGNYVCIIIIAFRAARMSIITEKAGFSSNSSHLVSADWVNTSLHNLSMYSVNIRTYYSIISNEKDIDEE